MRAGSRWVSDARGWTTGEIPYRDFGFEIRFDCIDHLLIVETTRGERREIPLRARPVAERFMELESSDRPGKMLVFADDGDQRQTALARFFFPANGAILDFAFPGAVVLVMMVLARFLGRGNPLYSHVAAVAFGAVLALPIFAFRNRPVYTEAQ